LTIGCINLSYCTKEKTYTSSLFSSKTDIFLLVYPAGSQPAPPTASDAATSTNNQEASGPQTSNSDPNTSN